MANIRISDLPAVTVPAFTDLYPTTQDSNGPATGVTRKITATQLFSLLVTGVPIGTTTPATGKFTTLESTGTATFASGSVNKLSVAGGATNSPVVVTASGDASPDVRFTTSGQGWYSFIRMNVGQNLAGTTVGTNRVFTAYSANTLSGSSPGAVYRFGGTVTGTIDASLTGFFPIVLDSDTLKFSNTSNGMVFNYVGQTLAAGWSGGRATHQSYLTIGGNGSAGDITGGNNAYHVSGSSFINVQGKMGGNSGDTRGNVFARNDGFIVLSGGGYHINSAVGHEIDAGVRSGAEVLYKVGHKLGLWQQDAVRGAIADYGYSQQLTAGVSGASSPGWRVGYALGGYEAWWPYTASTQLMGKVQTAPSIASGAPPYALGIGLDLRGIAITEGAFASPSFLVNGSGYLGALVASGVTVQTRSTIVAKTAGVATVTVVESGLYKGAITLTPTSPQDSGTPATATVATQAINYVAEINTRGTGYAEGDTITVVGGTSSATCVGVVTEVSGGEVYGVKFTTVGDYSVLPTWPASVTTSGSGIGFTFTGIVSILTVNAGGAAGTVVGTNYSEWLPPDINSTATTVYRPAKFKVTMTGAQANLLLNPAGQALFPTQGAVAGVGATQGTAAAITSDYLDVSATAGQTGVILPAAVRGMRKVVTGNSGNGGTDVDLYPASGEDIWLLGTGSLGANNAQQIGAGNGYALECTVVGRWYAYPIS